MAPALPQLAHMKVVAAVVLSDIGGPMDTYQIKNGDQLFAFEIDNIYINLSMVAKLLLNVNGVTCVQLRRIFEKSPDIHINFRYLGQPYIVWEPYGDSSRYWIGPVNSASCKNDIADLDRAFKEYAPSLFRLIIGRIISFRFIFWILKKCR